MGNITRMTVPMSAAMALAAPLAAAAPSPELAALALLEHGQWELRERGKEAPRRVCVTHGSQLLQLRHPGRQCRSFVIRDEPRQASVAYDCAAGGRGRTDVRVETARLVQIESQGVGEGAPFVLALEGRHVGRCEAAALAR